MPIKTFEIIEFILKKKFIKQTSSIYSSSTENVRVNEPQQCLH